MPGIFQLVGRIGQCREGHAVTGSLPNFV
jgi:hypothetical protein